MLRILYWSFLIPLGWFTHPGSTEAYGLHYWCSYILHFIPWPVSKSVEKESVGKCAISQHPVTLIRMGHWIKARTHTHWKITKCPTQQQLEPQEPLILWPCGPWPQHLLSWEVCDFSMVMGSCFISQIKCFLPIKSRHMTIWWICSTIAI